MGIIFAQLGDELPARHLVGVEPGSTVAQAAEAVRVAFKLPDAAAVQLTFAGRPLSDESATLAVDEVPASAILTAAHG